ncbi:hypothetical protein B0H10DRAFT_1940858 [Mycena sp. CBHHK59/15]|nr:hypothetical protein B0H10DRAFT_1940858 [Mycena sp. CBHHK59/15]
MATPKPQILRTKDMPSTVFILHSTFDVPFLMLAARRVDGELNHVLPTQLVLDACLIITSQKGYLSKNSQRQEAVISPEIATFLNPGEYYYHCKADAHELYSLCASFADWVPPDRDSLPPHWSVLAQQGFEFPPKTSPTVHIKPTWLTSSPGSLAQREWYKRHKIYRQLQVRGPIPPNSKPDTYINDVRNVISMAPTIHNLLDLPARTENYILYCAFAWAILNMVHRDNDVPTWPAVSVAHPRAVTMKKRRRDSSVEGRNKRPRGGGAGADRSRRGSGGADSHATAAWTPLTTTGGQVARGRCLPSDLDAAMGGYYPGCERVAELKARYIAEHPEVRATSTSVG